MVTEASEKTGVTATVTGLRSGASAVSEVEQFLRDVLVWPGSDSAPGFVNLHVNARNQKPGGKPYVNGWPYKKVGDFLNRAGWIDNGSPFFNVWMCMSQQSVAGKSKNGKDKAVRLAQNATWVKAIWIDVDVKAKPPTWEADHPGEPWTHYDTFAEALGAIGAFMTDVGLPAVSAAVNSGGGLHLYWTSDVPLTLREWHPYADGLKALLLQKGIKCDAGLTTDIARLLRVPGTLNHKYSPPRPVTLVHLGQMYNFEMELAVLRGVAPTKSMAIPSPSLCSVIAPGCESAFENGPDPAFAALPLTDTLGAGISRRSTAPLDPGPVFDNCAFLGDALKNGGKDHDQSQWNLGVLCTTFMDNGEALAHRISRGHEDYTPTDTTRMYERKLTERTERGIGYPSCAAIAGAGCKACQACPHLKQGKSPLHLTRPIIATVNSGSTAAAPASGNATANSAAHTGVQPPTRNWPDGCNKHGTPVKGYANTLTAIRELNIVCKFDTFRQKEFSQGHAIASLDGELSDRAVTMLGDQISSTFGFYPGKDILREALTAECSRNAYNPVTDYFNSLKWDGTPRLSKLMHRYLEAEDTPLNEAISKKLLCAIVRRSKRPGCKYDHEVVLQGDQGARKSMFCEDLAVFPDLFTDAGDLAGSIKEQMEIAQGKQIIEFAELAGFSQNSRERNKAYLSRRVDRARLAYGHYAKDQPRSSVPIGTTNPGGYLNDPTGERRYWHVAVKTYNRDAFLADKDQLYAEAVLLEPNERLWLDTPELTAAHDAIAATAKEPNTLVDDLHDLVGEIWEVRREQTSGGWLIQQEERVSNREVRGKLGLVGVNVHSMRDLGRRISDAMASLGWTKATGTLVCRRGGSAEGGYRRRAADRFEPIAEGSGETAESPTTKATGCSQ